ncbi:MAG: Fur family transcriptional regulator, stress-responsive regulator [Solirubrobacteraceae bacterium]|jgi:Fur family ferric uptake transcriptional regulator|nr:Fur family transcriptional regulator, stress-responsive regulator [Solirubrobacteraceae bacterium]
MERDGAGWDPAERLRAHRLRATPQRRAILDAFDGGSAEHLSAEEILARASSKVQGIGRGTVYSTLADLSEVGLLASVGDQDPIRYEINTTDHDHFRCRLCVRLFDITIETPALKSLTRAGYVIESVTVVVEGICRDCRAYGKGLADGAKAVGDTVQLGDDVLSTLACIRHDTHVGTLLFAASADGIARVAFEEHADFAALAERARSRRGGHGARDRAAHLVDGVDRFLAGDHEPMADLVDWGVVGKQGRTSLEATHTVGWGERRSYHRVCGEGLDAYACGYLMGSNPVPLLIPCHRITCGHELAGSYVGGLAARDLLETLEHS